MGVRISGEYRGALKMALTHEPSGRVIPTAAPVDNAGDGSSFSPTDLVAAALGSCMITTMGIFAAREGIPFESARFSLEKHMRSGPRRIDRIPVTVLMPAGLTDAQRRRLEEIALGCPVYQTLRPEIEKEVEFVYPEREGVSG
jgi:putative redox protein